jgi:hypothetical protein
MPGCPPRHVYAACWHVYLLTYLLTERTPTHTPQCPRSQNEKIPETKAETILAGVEYMPSSSRAKIAGPRLILTLILFLRTNKAEKMTASIKVIAFARAFAHRFWTPRTSAAPEADSSSLKSRLARAHSHAHVHEHTHSLYLSTCKYLLKLSNPTMGYV